MEKEILWTLNAQKDFWEIVTYLAETWPKDVLKKFEKTLSLKTELLGKQPYIGFKSSKYSRFRKTLITKNYTLIYSIRKDHIVIHRVKHTKMK